MMIEVIFVDRAQCSVVKAGRVIAATAGGSVPASEGKVKERK
jgi:hypothetical protein